MVLYLHQSHVYSLNVAQCVFAMSNGGFVMFRMLVSGLWTLDVQERPWGFSIAECNLSQAALDYELFPFGFGFGCFHCSLHLLLHALHVIVATPSVSTRTEPAVRLEEVRLSKLISGLVRGLSRSTTDLAKDLVVEILSDGSLGTLLVQVTGGGHELLQLDSSDEVLVLRGHQAVVLGKQCNLVIALGAFGIFFKVSCTVLC